MRAILVCVLLCGALATPVAAQSKIRAEKAVEASKPYIEAALATPMSVLTEKAVKKAGPKDHAYLGLAMLAGRRQPNDGQEAKYAEKLEALEARLLPISDAYVEAHPGVDFQTVDWVGELKPKAEELLVAVYYQQRYSADYWLGQALARRNMAVTTPGPVNAFNSGRSANGSPGVQPTRGSTMIAAGREYSLNRTTILTAAACVRAVRIAAGSSYQGPRDALPMAVFLMRKFPLLDIDKSLAQDEERTTEDKGYRSGAEACGTPEQFGVFVAQLRASQSF